ncbi:breast carcinoma-amplified sequence [Anaeramoeba flamelloides]|uniref:Breast carcinoma-amplified sequence n=1 Tax=Anaeramoeba flamelloides TaxID=1746091 RepID=A0AAV7YYZ8_9EUKA|nr:breast carcinoma-amplified sequence [Anaeramoeba flamelloides]
MTQTSFSSEGMKARKLDNQRNFFLSIINNSILQNSKQNEENSILPMAREQITLIKFLELKQPYSLSEEPIPEKILAIGYKNGWQLWNLDDLENIEEIASIRSDEVLCISFIYEANKANIEQNFENENYEDKEQGNENDNNDEEEEDEEEEEEEDEEQKKENKKENKSRFKGKFPIVGIVFKHQTRKYSRNKLYLWSLTEHKFVGTLNFQNEVLNFKSNARALVVGTKEHVLILDPISFEIKRKFQCYPNPTHTAVFALGERYLAYPCPSDFNVQKLLQQQKEKEKVKENCIEIEQKEDEEWFENYKLELKRGQKQTNLKLSTRAKIGKFGNKLFKEALKISGDSTKKVINVITNSGENEKLNEEELPINPRGSIIIRDIVDYKIITFFKAHNHSLAYLEFDKTGTMLITSSKVGTQYHIIKLNPKLNPPRKSYQQLYTLNRGMTRATTTGAFFSPDMNKIAISSNHGTIHLFLLNPFGGDFPKILLNPKNDFGINYLKNSEIIKLNTISRIKDGKLKSKEQRQQEELLDNMNDNFLSESCNSKTINRNNNFNENDNNGYDVYDDKKEKKKRKNKQKFENIPVTAQFIDSNKLMVIGNNGILSIYSTQIKEKNSEKNLHVNDIPLNSLDLSIDLISKFDVCRLSSWRQLKIPWTKIQNKTIDTKIKQSHSNNHLSGFQKTTEKYVPNWNGSGLEKSKQILLHEKLVMSEMETYSYQVQKDRILKFNNKFQFSTYSGQRTNKEKDYYRSFEWFVKGFSKNDLSPISTKKKSKITLNQNLNNFKYKKN